MVQMQTGHGQLCQATMQVLAQGTVQTCEREYVWVQRRDLSLMTAMGKRESAAAS